MFSRAQSGSQLFRNPFLRPSESEDNTPGAIEIIKAREKPIQLNMLIFSSEKSYLVSKFPRIPSS